MVFTGPVIRRRLALLMAVFFALFIVLCAKLFSLQVLKAQELQLMAQSQWTSESIIEPTRGKIYDRNGNILAQSATAYTLSASPRQIKNAAADESPLVAKQIYKECSGKKADHITAPNCTAEHAKRKAV